MDQIKDDKLKTLSPTLRQKKRFVKISLESKKKYEFDEISAKLSKEITFYLGSIDFGLAGIWFIKDKFVFDKQELVLRVSTKFKDKLVGSLSLINKIDSDDIKINTLRISGTLKGLNKD